ncbi:MAG: LON peptidase substrate-binding domain-containing protein [Chthoniobacterales bacterium]
MDTQFPTEIPIMVLPEVSLFPNAMLPLYIFEPRYREMLKTALENDRIFAVAMQGKTENEVHDVAGAGLIRACVTNPDGTSNLILQGIRRVRFTGWRQMAPYRIAITESLHSVDKVTPETAQLTAEIQKICFQLRDKGIDFPKQFDPYLRKGADADALGDIISSVLVSDPAVRQSLLEELNVTHRLKGLLDFLRSELGK